MYKIVSVTGQKVTKFIQPRVWVNTLILMCIVIHFSSDNNQRNCSQNRGYSLRETELHRSLSATRSFSQAKLRTRKCVNQFDPERKLLCKRDSLVTKFTCQWRYLLKFVIEDHWFFHLQGGKLTVKISNFIFAGSDVSSLKRPYQVISNTMNSNLGSFLIRRGKTVQYKCSLAANIPISYHKPPSYLNCLIFRVENRKVHKFTTLQT